MKVLIIEDEEQLSQLVKQVVEKEGNVVTCVDSIEEALQKNYQYTHDIVILDLMLVGKRGEYFVQEVRKNRLSIPILVMSALQTTSSKIELLNIGADDYLTKPFDSNELIARLNSLYRRSLNISQKEEMAFEKLTYLTGSNRVKIGDQEIKLTKKEGELLEILISNHGKTVRAEDLIRKLWGSKVSYHSNVLQACVRRLRKKIESGERPELIINHHGIGYSINV